MIRRDFREDKGIHFVWVYSEEKSLGKNPSGPGAFWTANKTITKCPQTRQVKTLEPEAETG